VVDVTTAFLGPRPENGAPPSPMGCGLMGWQRLPRITELIAAMRDTGVPVVFTKGDLNDKIFCGGSTKPTRTAESARRVHEATFPAEMAPHEDEYVLTKPKASAFFGTPLASYLVRNGIDTLVLAGVATSGCVRATAVDAASHNFHVCVVEDACFDRSEFAHAANLFDIQMKYGDVVRADEVRTWVELGAAAVAAR
jgi:nicotinamidase-related amidase